MGGIFKGKKELDPDAVAQQASDAPTVDQGLAVLEQLTQSPDFSTSEELQGSYGMALVNLTARATAAQAASIFDKLLALPVYQRNENPRLHHCRALVHAANMRARQNLAEGAQVAALFARFPGYAEDPHYQVAHAQALFGVASTSEKEAEILPLAKSIRSLPMFDQIGEIQFEFSKLMSNLVAYAEQDSMAETYCQEITILTGFQQLPFLQEAHQRAHRNLERRLERRPKVTVTHAPDMEDPGPDAPWWQVQMRVVSRDGSPVFFRDESESALQMVRGRDEDQARKNALTSYRAILKQAGHDLSAYQIEIGYCTRT